MDNEVVAAAVDSEVGAAVDSEEVVVDSEVDAAVAGVVTMVGISEVGEEAEVCVHNYRANIV